MYCYGSAFSKSAQEAMQWIRFIFFFYCVEMIPSRPIENNTFHKLFIMLVGTYLNYSFYFISC